jgi:hypothetical protein
MKDLITYFAQKAAEVPIFTVHKEVAAGIVDSTTTPSSTASELFLVNHA